MKRLLVGLSLIVVALLLAAGVYLLATNGRPSAPEPTGGAVGWRNPPDRVDVAAVAPDLALRALAGEPATIGVEQALAVEELAAAYAGIVFSADLDDTQRAGLLLALADHHIRQGNEEGALDCLRQLRDLAALSPALSDPLRADISAQMGVYWRDVGVRDEARRSFDQAYGIAAGSRTMPPASRRQVFLRLADEYATLGDAARAEDAEQMARVTHAPDAGGEAVGPVLDALYGEAALSAEVAGLVAERQARARHIVEVLMQDLTADVSPEAADLGEFLRREDTARQAWYAEARNLPDLAARASAAREHVRWLAVKWRVALRGYGLTLVPEWEADAAGSRAALSAGVTEWAQIMASQLVSLADERQRRQGELELLRQQVLWGRLGLYPDYPAEALVQGMLEAVETLRMVGQLGGLRLEATGEGGSLAFMVVENR